MQHAPEKIAVLIVNYGTAHLVIDNIEKLRAELFAYSESRICIVDNKSPGDDLKKLQTAFFDNEEIVVVGAADNGGFAAGNNTALEAMKDWCADYYFLLNPDAYPMPGAIAALIEILKLHPDAAISGPRIIGPNGEIQSGFFRFPNPFREFANEAEIGALIKIANGPNLPFDNVSEPILSDWVSGAAVMVRASAVGEKLMDERFFLYFEETDLMYGLKKSGWQIWHTPDASVVHIGGGATGHDTSGRHSGRLPDFWFSSWREYYLKNHGRAIALIAALAKLAGLSLYYIKIFVLRRASTKPDHYYSDVFNKCLVGLFTRRR